MPTNFPISIAGTRFRTARALAKDIAERGENCILPGRASGHPSDYYARWMRADDIGATMAAVLEACALLIDEDVSGDAWDHAVALTGSHGSEATTLRVLERVEAADIPDSRWFGTGAEVAHRALDAVTYAIETRMADQRGRLAKLFEGCGDFYGAARLLVSGGVADPAIVDLVGRWAKTRPIPSGEARILARRVRRHPPLVVPLAEAFAAANDEARERFKATIDEYAPDRSAEVAAALSMTTSWNFCQRGGLLANTRRSFPTDPGDFYGEGRLDLVPCSHLVCGDCGEVVCRVDGRVIPSDTDLGARYETSDWRTSELTNPTDLPNRAYACRCAVVNVVSDTLISTLQQDRPGGVPLAWSCAGHPTVRGDLVLEGVTVTDPEDIDALVFRALDGRPPGSLDAPWAQHGAIWVLRLHGRLRGHALEDDVSRAVGRALSSDSAGARSEALTFFLQHPFVPGSEELLTTLRATPELYAGIHGPDTPEGETLQFQLLRILGMRLELDTKAGRAPDAGALDILREASLEPGLAGATLPYLSAVDTRWVLDHRLAMARANKANARAVSLWVGIHAGAHEDETDQLLVREGLLDEGDL